MVSSAIIESLSRMVVVLYMHLKPRRRKSITMPSLANCPIRYGLLYTLIGCTYRDPNNPSLNDTTISEFLATIASIDSPCKNICDYFNLPTINWMISSDPLSSESTHSSLDICGWQQHVHLPSRNHSISDLIFCYNVTPTSVMIGETFDNSDHKAGLCTLPILDKCNKLKTVKTRFHYRDYVHADWETFQFITGHLDWSSFFTRDKLS